MALSDVPTFNVPTTPVPAQTTMHIEAKGAQI